MSADNINRIVANKECGVVDMKSDKMTLGTCNKKKQPIHSLQSLDFLILDGDRKSWLHTLKEGRASLPSQRRATIISHFVTCHIQALAELRHCYLHAVEGDIRQRLLAQCKIKIRSFLCRMSSCQQTPVLSPSLRSMHPTGEEARTATTTKKKQVKI